MAVVVPMTVNRVQFSNFKDQNNNVISKKTSRVLFGSPREKDIDAFLEEQHDDDKERFRVNFGIDVDDLEHLLPGSYLVNITQYNTQRRVNKLLRDEKLSELHPRRTPKEKTRLRSFVE